MHQTIITKARLRQPGKDKEIYKPSKQQLRFRAKNSQITDKQTLVLTIVFKSKQLPKTHQTHWQQKPCADKNLDYSNPPSI
jgi:hypothetical protein